MKVGSLDRRSKITSFIRSEDNINEYDIDFYEQICISCLSEDKFKELLLSIKPSDLTTTFWEHICSRICDPKSKENNKNNRYNKYSQSVVVGGFDKYSQLNEKPNILGLNGDLIISPPVKLSFDSSMHQSYSVYAWHSVAVTSGGSLRGVGCNKDGRISASLTKAEINDFTEFCVRDSNGLPLKPVSAVCCSRGTLYMFTKSGGKGRQLVLCDREINDGKEIYLDIGNQEPVALFGGRFYAAAINSEGEVIFINRNSIKNSPSSPITSFPLPDDEKASSVACCSGSVVALSSSGRVFSSVVDEGSSSLSFSAVVELSSHEIVSLSGLFEHCLCVSSEGRVFGCGSNSRGQLALGERTRSASSFTEISSLSGREIVAAYAGGLHSLFLTREGKVLSCGCNSCGQLLLSTGASEDVYSPKETTVTSNAKFCIAGQGLSVVFIGGEPPPNTPNMRIQQHQLY
ncbi:hypothetical protein M9Y10_026100 [Tritrichomonas musculus]|uniref:Uncharacterized protein n=1 Tax=Tritrichomonas musculus TaxID=1915356 RepID=A0ABR2H8I9_9EUKA